MPFYYHIQCSVVCYRCDVCNIISVFLQNKTKNIKKQKIQNQDQNQNRKIHTCITNIVHLFLVYNTVNIIEWESFECWCT